MYYVVYPFDEATKKKKEDERRYEWNDLCIDFAHWSNLMLFLDIQQEKSKKKKKREKKKKNGN